MVSNKSVDDLRVLVACGGKSAERDVSLESGRAVYDALLSAGISAEFCIFDENDLAVLEGKEFDIVFNAFHGEFGEDGAFQHLLDERAIPYTGSGGKACELAFDKLASKEAFCNNKVPTADWWALKSTTHVASVLGLSCVQFPAVVKPVCAGSSQGVEIVRESGELASAVNRAGRYDENIMVETYIEGREFTVGMLAGEALPVIELRTKRDFYDYLAKYEDDDTEYICPADLSDVLTRRLQQLALFTCKVVKAEHFARVDIMLDKNERPHVLEVNMIPGFTSHSLLPKAAAEAGIPFPELCKKIVALGWQRHSAQG
jgi:D-alanine-D-alanine ligase